MNKLNNKAFKSLQETWYKKAGFKPELAEYSVENTDGRYFYNQYGHQKFAAKQRYYELAGQFLHDYKFKNEEEKNVWRYHSNGKTIRQIAEILSVSKSPIHRTIKHLKEEMVRQYTKEEDRD